MNQYQKDTEWAEKFCRQNNLKPAPFIRTYLKSVRKAKQQQIPLSRALQFVQGIE